MDPKTKQKTLRLLANGIYVMTSRGAHKIGAATVTWVSQASFKPPLLTAALRKDGTVLECVIQSGKAVLHVLDKQQSALAQSFFAPTKATEGTLNGEAFTSGVKTGAPVLDSALAYLECEVREVMDRHGDHAIVLLEVVNAEIRREVNPLTVADSPWKYGG
jgi:flavin reductase (DIM6/NTAB) family NADH-FMN oxidoreductase RutF